VTRSVTVALPEEQYALLERAATEGGKGSVTAWARECLLGCAEVELDHAATYRIADFRERLLFLRHDHGERAEPSFAHWVAATEALLAELGLEREGDRMRFRDDDGALVIDPCRSVPREDLADAVPRKGAGP
jgi:hypothetical protein